jgi:hypothetical protein
MTIAIGAVGPEGAHIAVDDLSTLGGIKSYGAVKAWRDDENSILVVSAGKAALLDVLRCAVESIRSEVRVESIRSERNELSLSMLRDYMIGELSDMAWEPETTEAGLPLWDINALITDGRVIWEMLGALIAENRADGPAAVGAGFQVALGAYWALRSYGPGRFLHEKTLVTEAAKVACEVHVACGGTVQVFSQSPGMMQLVP